MTEHTYTSNDDKIITDEEQAIIVEWTRQNYKTFNSTGFNRQMQVLARYNKDYVPACIWDIKQRIVNKENLHDFKQEPIFKDAIGYMTDGGQLHEHTDPNPTDSNLIHTRFNVYVQIPEKGGLPIYNNKLCSLKEGTYVCCVSGRDKHYCQKVEGPRERIVLSFGFLLPPQRVEHVKYMY